MKTLYLLRHAKSSWKDRGLDDLDRPLNKRGRETAKTMAAYLRRAKITPDVVLCSTAVRAKQTLEPIAKAIKPPRVAFESRIYGVAQPELLKYLRGVPESVESALMIGHNPGLHDLALALAEAESRKRLPPCRRQVWERICSYADRRPVILSGPQAAFRLRAEARERAMLIKEKTKCSATS